MISRANDLAVTRQGHFVVTQNKQFQIKFNLSKGTWDYIHPAGHIIIRNAYAKIVLGNGTVLTTLDDGTREFFTSPLTEDEFGIYQSVKFSHQAEGKDIRINLNLNCYSKAPYVILTVSIENLSDNPIAVDEMTLIGVSSDDEKDQGGVYLGGPPSGYHLFLNTNPTSEQGVKAIYDGFKTSPQACYDGILYDTESQRALVFGFLSFQKWWPAIQVGYDSQNRTGRAQRNRNAREAQSRESRNKNEGINQWSLYHRCEQHRCRPGEEISSEPAYLNFSGHAEESYQLYTEMLAKRMNAQKLEQVFSGWSAYASDNQPIGAKYILGQVNQIARNRSFYPPISGGMEYIQIENSWQQSVGSHEVDSQNFPLGMKSVVDQIHAKGLKAGLRFAPFCVPVNSDLVKRQPEYFLKDKEKNVASVILPEDGTELALLDVSHPGAQGYIREHLRRIIDEWGYDLIKADLLAYTIGPMSELDSFRWHDKSLTVVELYRLGIQLLNQAIEESQRDVILSGVNVCNGPSIGGFSLNHTLSSYHGYMGRGLWPDRMGLKQFIGTSAPYLRMHNTTWTNELGWLVIDEPRPVNEVIVAITAAALSGGVVTCADNLTTLKSTRAELLAKLFPLIGKAATPVDLYKNVLPETWNLPIRTSYDSWNVVGVFNWKDEIDEAHFTLDTLGLDRSKDYLVHDFWNREYLGTIQGSMTLLNIPPRSAKLLCIRAEKRNPQLLATDIHFTQGGVEILSAGWDAKSQHFLIICKPPRNSKGTVFIHVPEDYVPVSTACYGGNYQFNWQKPIYELTFSPATDFIHASIQFSKTSG